MRINMQEMREMYSDVAVEDQFNTNELLNLLEDANISPLECKTIRLKKHEMLITEGDDSEHIYVIEEGNLMMTDCQSKMIDFFFEQDIIGLTKFLFNDQSKLSFEVISEELVVKKFKKEDVIEKIMNKQEGYFFHYQHMHKEIERMQEKEKILRLPTEERIGRALLLLGNNYHNWKQKQSFLVFPQAINRKMLANYTSLTQNTITKVLQKFECSGLIRSNRRMIHIYPEKLEAGIGIKTLENS
ncbi:putative CRP/FNR family transcriptional regulator [Listeria grandensis FSL F6-0971]|uniref:Putative CRP/FNR family transcriptional regulator n=2 Tax=Listeria grandensis TaxID=1494963 RepID=W7AX53_9LIST|nr:putative CRP/FNR family transcriptional regulator [Listeria grandensis FSL F6-0971]